MTPRFLTILTGRNVPKIQSENIEFTIKRLREPIEDTGRGKKITTLGFAPSSGAR
jgi:hypothetical protein